MRYMPAIELTPDIRRLLAGGALRLQPGQWLTDGGARGRYLRVNRRTGTPHVCWTRPGERFADQTARFHRACVKGFVGRHGRPAWAGPRRGPAFAARPKTDPELPF